MANKLANPAPLGLMGFGMTTVLLNLVNAGIIPESIGMVLPMGLFYGGLAQFLAGMWEMKTGNTFGATAFGSFGSFWMAFALMVYFDGIGFFSYGPTDGIAAFLIIWGIFTALMAVGTLRLNRALQVVFVTLALLFFLLALADATDN
ncbi:hypothetical protein GTN42_03865, partial [bacterium]|nr:hypothetical protein [bacterium]